MTVGQGLNMAIMLISNLKKQKGLSQESIDKLDEVIKHLKFVEQFYL